MESCIFCKIVKGELPSYKIYEDKDFLGFLDINPRNIGHSLVIPKAHYRYVSDVPNFGDYWEAAKKVALAIKIAVKAKSINFLTIGEEVPHAHIWIIPRFDDDGGVIQLGQIKKIDKQKMVEVAGKIRANL